jgi:tetratricopeptide (TPR) repeat protein
MATFETRDNLPLPPDDFIGRGRYVDSVLHALLNTKAWIISIDGIGGVGKSRLALEVAHRTKELGRYAGIVWVSAKGSWLTPSGIERREPSFTSLDDLLRQIVRVAGVHEDPGETLDERKARVSKIISQTPYLLIIDNLETVRGDDRALISEFLNALSARETGDTKALVTSRETTSPGAIVIEVGGFELDEAIRLICQDAQNFGDESLLLAERDVLSDIWRGCAGLPLAIKWTVAMVARRKIALSDTLVELRRSSGDVLQYIFGSVFEKLGDDAKSLLYTASAFVSSIPRSALSDVTTLANTRVGKALAELLGLYLIHRVPRPAGRFLDGERYEILPATRLCVEAICGDTPGIDEAFISRAVVYYSRLWTGFTPSFGLEQFEDDYENSVYLLDHSFTRQRWAEVVDLAKRLDPYVSVRGLVEDRIEICNLGVLAARHMNDGRSVVELRQAKGKAYKQKGMYREAEEQLRECLEFYRNTGMNKEAVRIRMQLGIVVEHQVEYSVDPVAPEYRKSRLEEALVEYSEACKTFAEIGDRAGQAQSLHLMGRALRHLNRFGESEEKLLESIRLKQELGDAVRTAITEHELARLRGLNGRIGEAETLYRKAIATLTEFGATKDMANAKWGYSLLLRTDPNRLREALELSREAVAAYQRQGRRPKYQLAQADLQQLLSLLHEADLAGKGEPKPAQEVVATEEDEVRDGCRYRVFISYSHADSEWLRRLRVHLRPLERGNIVDLFDDTKIQPGGIWREEIEKALKSAKFAVLLVSADFLASDFIQENELPRLLKAAQGDGAVIIPVIVSACAFEETESLAQFQAANPPSQPLLSLSKNDQEGVLARVANVVRAALNAKP